MAAQEKRSEVVRKLSGSHDIFSIRMPISMFTCSYFPDVEAIVRACSEGDAENV